MQLEVENSVANNRGNALLVSFQVRPILIDRTLEARSNDKETQRLLHSRNDGRMKTSELENQTVYLCKKVGCMYLIT